MKTTLITCGILTLLLVLFRPRRIIDPPLPPLSEDRQFLADEIERLVRLPLSNQQELEAWYRACNLIQDRIEARFGNAASVLPHAMFHYFWLLAILSGKMAALRVGRGSGNHGSPNPSSRG
ncbi:hypothetical protein, partial [Chthoniobacter flavus]|uniref:hypothetical protein n=1 Tax=Chthoniobacter flavus TaxID=191863 RepID=UPI001A9E32A3